MHLSEEISNPLDLAQGDATWFLALRSLDTHSELLPEIPITRLLLALVDIEDQTPLKLDILSQEPDRTQLIDFLQQAIGQQPGVLSERLRPKQIWVEETYLDEMLSPALAEFDISISLTLPDQALAEGLAGLQETFSLGMPVLSGLLSVPGANPSILRNLCSAAAHFYRHTPWRCLADAQPLSVTIAPPGKRYYIQIMGQAGLEYGLVIYQNWKDLEQFYQISDNPLSHIPASGWRSLTFESKQNLPLEDLIAIEKHACEIAAQEAYPFPVVYTLDDIQRPALEELKVFEVVMRALPEFVDKHLLLNEDNQGDYSAAIMQSRLELDRDTCSVTIEYPANPSPAPDSPYLTYLENQKQIESDT